MWRELHGEQLQKQQHFFAYVKTGMFPVWFPGSEMTFMSICLYLKNSSVGGRLGGSVG